MANQDVFWQVRRDFGKRDFGISGRVLAIQEVFWKFSRDFGNLGGTLAIRRDFGNLRGGLEI